MESKLLEYPDWKAPSEDGQVLISPSREALLKDTQENQARLSGSEARLQHVPLAEVRRRMRQFVGHDDSRPLVATGHQVELHHPGVWVKNILIDRLAREVGGQGYHIAIDTDAPKHLTIRWPGEALPITDDARLAKAAWSAELAPPTPSHIAHLAERLAQASAEWNFAPILPELLDSLRRLSLESLNLPAALSNAMHELDWSLGLRHHVLLASPMWISEPYLLFVHDLLAKADVVAERYNAALAAYRTQAGIRSSSRPMPDLVISDEAVEIPFWLDDLDTGQRLRPTAFHTDDGWVLELTSGDRFTFRTDTEGWTAAAELLRWLRANRLRLTPRALTNTLFLRLLLADQFVHGIGGGRYDQVTDRLILAHYGIQPPRFAVATATLYFPAALNQERVCLPCVKQEGHRLKHGLLGDRKREYVAAIDSLPRASKERTTRFYQMHSDLAAAAAGSDVLTRWQERFRETQIREKQEQTLFDRELFYAIQPRQRLEALIARFQ